MATRTTTMPLEMSFGCGSCEVEATIHYEHEQATGDGWNEPRYPESVTVCAVEVWFQGPDKLDRTMDLLPLLPAPCVAGIATDILTMVADEREDAKYAAAIARAEMERDFA
jgi:hypothetical protein